MPDRYIPEQEAEILAFEHQKANNPYEPYQGVQVIFNGDAHLQYPYDRPDWTVVSRYKLEFSPAEKELIPEEVISGIEQRLLLIAESEDETVTITPAGFLTWKSGDFTVELTPRIEEGVGVLQKYKLEDGLWRVKRYFYTGTGLMGVSEDTFTVEDLEHSDARQAIGESLKMSLELNGSGGEEDMDDFFNTLLERL